MAAIALPAPGTELGPCKTCEHTDCARSRSEANQECAICHESIGYETRYYRDVWSMGVFIYTHARCVE